MELISTKPIILQGEKGYSKKGSLPANASYYYSFSRIKTNGTIIIDDKQFDVVGNSWMDREWSSSALEKGQVGWDWFSIQLSDGRDIMIYRIRRTNGDADPNSKAIMIDKFGKHTNIPWQKLNVNSFSNWISPKSGRKYPSGWKIVIPSEDINIEINPMIKNQELRTSINYWEGAVKVKSMEKGQNIEGYGYVELTGY